MTGHFNKSDLRETRRFLRKNLSDTEALLWTYLSGRQLDGHKFRRQYSVDSFVIDFYCAQAKLAIEIDGVTHLSEEQLAYDRQRQAQIEIYGIRMIRFSNAEVRNNIQGVLRTILEEVSKRAELLSRIKDAE